LFSKVGLFNIFSISSQMPGNARPTIMDVFSLPQ
jgi:hypothetical protein